MPKYVVLLRAVNVGGYGKLAMADFRRILADLGYRNVQTYIQSGNAVFDAPDQPPKVTKAVASALEKFTRAPASVLIRTHEELTRVINANPFAAEAAADGARVHVAFLSGSPPASAAAGLERIVTQYPERRDRYHLSGDTLYLHLPDGAAETRFTPDRVHRALGFNGTARNWNTVLKLHAMSAP
ncbi:MAG TPA: DUF1697 domain-containing protein [Terracidiphilus sp.]|nr:DUF1697 domain-containing protein [Terracidiphilus sp.]